MSSNNINVGAITATAGSVTINAPTISLPGGGGNITASGTVTLTETGGIATTTNHLLTTNPVICTRAPGGTCSATAPLFELVNASSDTSIISVLSRNLSDLLNQENRL